MVMVTKKLTKAYMCFRIPVCLEALKPPTCAVCELEGGFLLLWLVWNYLVRHVGVCSLQLTRRASVY